MAVLMYSCSTTRQVKPFPTKFKDFEVYETENYSITYGITYHNDTLMLSKRLLDNNKGWINGYNINNK